MRPPVLLALAAALLITPAAAETLTLYSNAGEDGLGRLGQPGGKGGMIVWNSALETGDRTG